MVTQHFRNPAGKDLPEDNYSWRVHVNQRTGERVTELSRCSRSKPLVGDAFPAAGLNTNIDVTRRQLLVITASRSDRWSINSSGGPVFSSTANGIVGGVPFPPLLTLGEFTFPHGALIGSLDMGKTFFAIGTQMEMTVLRPGTLRLYCWDNDFANNDGTIRVDVKVYRQPEAPSAL